MRCPFPSLVVGSDNDPLAKADRAALFARAWGGRLIALGAVGHLNPASGFGPWPGAIGLLETLDEDLAA